MQNDNTVQFPENQMNTADSEASEHTSDTVDTLGSVGAFDDGDAENTTSQPAETVITAKPVSAKTAKKSKKPAAKKAAGKNQTGKKIAVSELAETTKKAAATEKAAVSKKAAASDKAAVSKKAATSKKSAMSETAPVEKKVSRVKKASAAASIAAPAILVVPESSDVVADTVMVAPVQKKRGRPSKADLAAMGRLPSTTVVDADKPVATKRSGRPKGSKSIAKAPVIVAAKRGRKSKVELEAIAAAAKEQVVKLADELTYKVPSAWDAKDLNRKVIFSFSEQYKTFLDKVKTEREFVKEAVIMAERKGFRNLDAVAGDHPLVPGDRVYRVVKNKLIMLAVIGEKPLVEGVRILGAHVDSPRIDIKQNPLYEVNEMAFLKTHYYGGIKKYQWAAIPLAIHGVFVKTDGTTVEIVVGEDEKDPIFTITDLLPHLAKDQYEKKLADAFAGEAMNILLGSEPVQVEDTKEKVKLNLLRLLNESHGIKEEDFLSAELEIVPAFKARDLGLDRSMIGAYGHDDRVCAYPAMMAVLESENPETTSLCVLTDKEEIGSVGNTGAESRAMENFLADLCAMSTAAPYTDRALRKCLDRSKMLSADVTAALDPNYENTHDKLNASYLGKGIAIMKYSGARGKSGASDAHAEYVAEIRKILNDAGVAWQTTELGAVDKGGGGTIAMMIANLGVDVIDCGVPVLSMHAPFEVVSKVDLYNTYKAYVAFLK